MRLFSQQNSNNKFGGDQELKYLKLSFVIGFKCTLYVFFILLYQIIMFKVACL